jgi:hypothetical protein
MYHRVSIFCQARAQIWREHRGYGKCMLARRVSHQYAVIYNQTVPKNLGNTSGYNSGLLRGKLIDT